MINVLGSTGNLFAELQWSVTDPNFSKIVLNKTLLTINFYDLWLLLWLNFNYYSCQYGLFTFSFKNYILQFATLMFQLMDRSIMEVHMFYQFGQCIKNDPCHKAQPRGLVIWVIVVSTQGWVLTTLQGKHSASKPTVHKFLHTILQSQLL